MKFTLLILLFAILSSCGEKEVSKKISKLYITDSHSEFQQKANELGLQISGTTILTLTGTEQSLALFDQSMAGKISSTSLESIKVFKPNSFKPKADALYMAKQDFNLPAFLKKYPKYDGRGVKVGVIDDGISPSQKSFQTTSDGKRKFLKRASSSSFYHIELADSASTVYSQAVQAAFPGKKTLEGKFSEKKKKFDLNDKQEEDEKAEDNISITVVKAQTTLACIDKNANEKVDASECFGFFGETGEYSFWDEAKSKSFLVDWVEADKKIMLSEPEAKRDSHGEGVASVISAYMLGGKFSGVAPGTQLLDYDLSEKANGNKEDYYTINTFIKAFEWLGENGADVANVSYSLFFTSVQAQEFMRKAIAKIVDKYNMVISFSAGNNGPGLGSLNRRSIYPNSVMVAGAYVSKQLDEYVHGVTGLPDEGRVIWYSSRGPGPNDAFGPLMISPLSSLTYKDEQSGYGAFSGTSSAAPALAGIASVLISAVKQEGLKVDAKTIVHALRSSAKRLEKEPFVFQGYGLPQIGKALEIYKEMIAGKRFLELEAKLHHFLTDEGTKKRGLLLRGSEFKGQHDFRAVIKGSISKIAPAGTARELLDTLKIEYSHPWITGPSHLWASVTEGRFYLSVDMDKALATGELESFGEVRFYNSQNGELYHIFPVTIVNDIPLLKNRENFSLSLDSHEGKRLHFYVPQGIDGIKIKTDILQGNPNFRYMIAYGPNRVKTFLDLDQEQFIATKQEGWYQITLFTHGGTQLSAKVNVQVEPINLKLNTRHIKVEEGDDLSLTLSNTGTALGGKLVIRERRKLVAKDIVYASEGKADLVLEAKIKKPGSYSISAGFVNQFETNYAYIGCGYELTKKDGNKESDFSRSYEKEGEDEEVIRFTCQAFDYDYSGMGYRLRIFHQNSDAKDLSEYSFIKKGMNKISISNVAEGSYDVFLVNPFVDNGQEIGLGSIRVASVPKDDKDEGEE